MTKRELILLSALLVGNIPRLFYGDLGGEVVALLGGYSIYLDQLIYGMCDRLSIIIILYVLFLESRIVIKKTSLFILIITMLDLIHFLYNGQKGLIELKFLLSIIMTLCILFINTFSER